MAEESENSLLLRKYHRPVLKNGLNLIQSALSMVRDSLGADSPCEYWRETQPILDKEEVSFWTQKLGMNETQLYRHFRKTRPKAWQIVKEFSFARYWFTQDRLVLNPFYPKIRRLAQNYATIVDLGCGLGQELRYLRRDGATGTLIGVDNRSSLWECGLESFKDANDWKDSFIEADLVLQSQWAWSDYRNPLRRLAGQIDVFLLNDLIFSWGEEKITRVLDTIHLASRVGTRVMGWVIGQDERDPKEEDGHGYWGESRRGGILTPSLLKGLWWPSGHENVFWWMEVKVLNPRDFGFDQVDQEWFNSKFFHEHPQVTCNGKVKISELKILCFLFTRCKSQDIERAKREGELFDL